MVRKRPVALPAGRTPKSLGQLVRRLRWPVIDKDVFRDLLPARSCSLPLPGRSPGSPSADEVFTAGAQGDINDGVLVAGEQMAD